MNEECQLIVRSLCEKIKAPSLSIKTYEENPNSLEQKIQQEIQSLTPQQQTRIMNEFFHFGPLHPLLEDDDISEIIINSWDEVWFEKHGHFHRCCDSFLSPLTFENFIHRICRLLKTQITFETPFICSTFNNLRFHIISPTITSQDYSVTIRKHRIQKMTLQNLIDNHSLTEEQKSFTEKIISERRNFLVIGATGSGKTTFVNACLQKIAAHERIVIIEDTSELVAPNSLSTKVLTRKDSHGLLSVIDLSVLIREALRMRPDRIVLGEVRGPEAKDLLLALSTGHVGSIGTLHAHNAHESLLRLEMLIQLGAPDWNLESIRRLIYLSLHYIFTIRRNDKGERQLSSIHRVVGMESFGILLEEIKLPIRHK